MQKHILRWLQAKLFFRNTAVIATFIVVYLSLSPLSGNKPWTLLAIRGDLVLHFICYFGITVLYFAAFFTYKKTLQKAFFSSILLGFILELLQLIPMFNRFFDILDLLANGLGVGFGIVLGIWLKRIFKKG